MRRQTYIIFHLFISIVLISCVASNTADTSTTPLPSEANASTATCPVTEPIWLTPPEDKAILDTPEPGYYFVNQDTSIWASAWWAETPDAKYLRAGEKGIKVGWFRPAGEALEITGHRIDDKTVALETHIPCCYPSRFQATGLIFPEKGCWEITATAGNSELSFFVQVAS